MKEDTHELFRTAVFIEDFVCFALDTISMMSRTQYYYAPQTSLKPVMITLPWHPTCNYYWTEER